jgi:opacity protein-like surface antigen
MRIAARFCFLVALAASVASPASAQDASMASLTPEQLKTALVGDWTLSVGFGAGPMTITDVQNGQISVIGKMVLNYDTLTVTRGHIEGDRVTLNFNAGTLQGMLTNPRHMEGEIIFRGDANDIGHWFADRMGR